MTLRRQIAATVALVSLMVALTVGFLVHRSSVRQHTQQADTSATAALTEVLATYRSTGEPAGRNGAVDDPDLPAPLRRLAASGHKGTMLAPSPQGTAMWAAAPATDGRVISVRVDYTGDERAIADLDRTIQISVGLSVALTVLGGVLAADRISRRLRIAARTANAVAQGDLDARIGPLGRAKDEVAELAAAVDSMSATLRDKLAGEQRFTADVAHELRTPLTGLLTAAELLPPGRPTELVKDRVRFLCALTEDLLEISRLDARAEPCEQVTAPLGTTVARIVKRLGPPVRLRIEDDTAATTDPRRLERIVTNLIANAHRHGTPPVLITVTQRNVTIRDHGPGFPETILREGPQRFRTGAPERGRGHGLGLTIAQGHAQAIGITLQLRNDPDGGAVAELQLPAADTVTTAAGREGSAHARPGNRPPIATLVPSTADTAPHVVPKRATGRTHSRNGHLATHRCPDCEPGGKTL